MLIGPCHNPLSQEVMSMVNYAQHEAPHEDILNYVKSIPDDVLFQDDHNGYVC